MNQPARSAPHEIHQLGWKEGATVRLDLPEVAIHGPARIVKICPTQADSRGLPQGQALIISRYIHEGATLIALDFGRFSAPFCAIPCLG